MKTKYSLLLAFLVVAAAQLYVPTSMIREQEDIVATGKTFKFKASPIDPSDPMRGKYIVINFESNQFVFPDSILFTNQQDVFVEIFEDEDGFAKIKNVYKEIPGENMDFLKAKIGYPYYYKDSTRINIRYPFNRFYMEEFKAPVAEDIYFESSQDSLKTTWAVVKVKDGKGSLEDVMIDGVSIVDIVNAQQVN